MRHHPFLMHSLCTFQDQAHFYTILELMIPFRAFLKSQSFMFTEEEAKFYVAELVLAVEELHSNNIAHLDIASRNMLLDKNGHIVLMDYGRSYMKENECLYVNAPTRCYWCGFTYWDALNMDFAMVGDVIKSMMKKYNIITELYLRKLNPDMVQYRREYLKEIGRKRRSLQRRHGNDIT